MKNKEIWFFLFFLGFMFFNWPFLDIFNMVLPVYFIGVWGLFILAVAIVVSFSERNDRGPDV